MINRRDLLGSLALLLPLVAADAEAQTQPSNVSTVFKHDLPNVTMDGWEVNVNHVEYPPGRVGAAHKHPGFTLAYVLLGQVVTKVTGQPERVYKPGEMFIELPGDVHEVSRNASQTEPARLLALTFAKKGLPLTSPAD